MDDTLISLVFGFIFIILIINTSMISSISSTLYGDKSPQQTIDQGVSPSVSVAVQSNPVSIPTIVSPKPAITPPAQVHSTKSGAVTPVPVVTNNPIYVTIGSPEVLELETHTMIQPDIPELCEDDYVTLYSVTNQTLLQTLPHMYFNLVNPPLILDYDIIPMKSVDEKFLEHKELSTLYQENVSIIRPYEHAWAIVIVRSMDTGHIVAEDGFGKTYSFQSPKQLVIRDRGNFEFEFTGDYASMNMTMKAKREGNIP